MQNPHFSKNQTEVSEFWQQTPTPENNEKFAKSQSHNNGPTTHLENISVKSQEDAGAK